MNPILMPKAIEPVPVRCNADRFENMIREMGVGYCCGWFGHGEEGEFAEETARILQERSALARIAPHGEEGDRG